MRKKNAVKKKKMNGIKLTGDPAQWGALHTDLAALKEQVLKLTETSGEAQERLQDLEIHVNIITRLLTTLCIEKFGMRLGVLKRIIQRIEKEAIRDSQILHLENLYKMAPENPQKAPPPSSTSKNDPWDQIS